MKYLGPECSSAFLLDALRVCYRSRGDSTRTNHRQSISATPSFRTRARCATERLLVTYFGYVLPLILVHRRTLECDQWQFDYSILGVSRYLLQLPAAEHRYIPDRLGTCYLNTYRLGPRAITRLAGILLILPACTCR